MGIIRAAGVTTAGRAIKREVGEYAIDNALVAVIILAAVALRMRDMRRPAGQKPILLRAIEIMPDGFAPLPVEIAKLVAGTGK